MTNNAPQWQVSEVIAAPVAQVWQVLLAANPYLSAADKAKLAQNAAFFIASYGQSGAGKITIEVDVEQHSIATQGEWWYRGVQSVEAHPHGSRLVYSVYNVAPGIGWWAAQLVQGQQHAREMPQQITALAASIRQQLGITAEKPRSA